MKTKEQILEWLDKQPWKNEFYENCFKIGKNKIEYNEYFICGAFLYDDTPQGKYIWKERYIRYKEWYNSNDKPMSWEEYCEQNPITPNDCRITADCGIVPCDYETARNAGCDVNAMSKELCRAFVAYMKLIQLRNAWIQNYEKSAKRYKIITHACAFRIAHLDCRVKGLSFPNINIAQEFLDTFKDLLETAKPLL